VQILGDDMAMVRARLARRTCDEDITLDSGWEDTKEAVVNVLSDDAREAIVNRWNSD
jgi:hypothetical protein